MTRVTLFFIKALSRQSLKISVLLKVLIVLRGGGLPQAGHCPSGVFGVSLPRSFRPSGHGPPLRHYPWFWRALKITYKTRYELDGLIKRGVTARRVRR